MADRIRVVAFVDGFNLYHAIDRLRKPHLKWVNLWGLCEHFAPSSRYVLCDVLYFSAYATWRPAAYRRHRQYVKALRAVGVTAVMGKFKAKDRVCRRCGTEWLDHEEKETDVNIALHILRGAFMDAYDRALLISADSDLAPVLRMVRSEFPAKDLRVIAPVGRGHSMDLFNAAGGKRASRQMRLIHLERALFGPEVFDRAGSLVAVRPSAYDPPRR